MSLAWLLPVVALAQAPAPNVLLVVIDDLPWRDLGAHGGDVTTPTLDRLARAGVDVEQFYGAVDGPRARAALATGKLTPRFAGDARGPMAEPEVPHEPGARRQAPILQDDERLLSEVLRAAGYATYLVGKWSLGDAEAARLPLERGYDHHYGPHGDRVDHYAHLEGLILDWFRDGRLAPDDGYATDLIAGEAVRIIEAHEVKKPLFLHLSFTAVREPLQAPTRFLRRYLTDAKPQRRVYKAMLEALDEALAGVLAALDRRGIADETLVVVVSDGGGDVTEGAVTVPLRPGDEVELYEGKLRVPGLFVWPKRLAPRVVAGPAHLADVAPTILSLTGVPPLPGMTIDGIDLTSVLKGEPAPARFLPLHLAPGRIAVRQGYFKLISGPAGDELFDLEIDPAEVMDLSGAYPEVVQGLLEQAQDRRELRARRPEP